MPQLTFGFLKVNIVLTKNTSCAVKAMSSSMKFMIFSRHHFGITKVAINIMIGVARNLRKRRGKNKRNIKARYSEQGLLYYVGARCVKNTPWGELRKAQRPFVSAENLRK